MRRLLGLSGRIEVGDMYIYDASAIVNLIKKGVVRVFARGYTIDLAYYESLNAVWKEHISFNNIDKAVAIDFINMNL